jgi:hypothetical protein
MGKKVYIVTSGDYSDYHIEGVFSSKELADEYINMVGDDCKYGEWELDSLHANREDHVWCVRMNYSDKGKARAWIKDIYAYYRRLLGTFQYIDGELYFNVLADSKEKAIKIASERWGFIKANELTMFPYMRKKIISGGQYPNYDFSDGRIVVETVDEFDDDFLSYDIETYDESRFQEYLPEDCRYKIVPYK